MELAGLWSVNVELSFAVAILARHDTVIEIDQDTIRGVTISRWDGSVGLSVAI